MPVNSSTPTPPLARPALPASDEGRASPREARASDPRAVPAPHGFGDWLATMSHELRTPLNAILGYAQLLLLGLPHELPEPSRAQVDRMRLAARHLLHLLDEILTFARIDAGRETTRASAATLGQIVRETAGEIERRATPKRLRVAVSLPEEAIHLVTDEAKVRQILSYLGDASLALTEQGTVTLAGRADGDWVVVEVRDTGTGIAPERLERIFDPAWQAAGSADAVLGPGSGGAGLGLTIAYLLTRLLGGDITVKSRVGIGTTFIVRLPRGPAAPARAD